MVADASSTFGVGGGVIHSTQANVPTTTITTTMASVTASLTEQQKPLPPGSNEEGSNKKDKKILSVVGNQSKPVSLESNPRQTSATSDSNPTSFPSSPTTTRTASTGSTTKKRSASTASLDDNDENKTTINTGSSDSKKRRPYRRIKRSTTGGGGNNNDGMSVVAAEEEGGGVITTAAAAAGTTTDDLKNPTDEPPPPPPGWNAFDNVLQESSDLSQAALEAQQLGRLKMASTYLLLLHARLVGLGKRFDKVGRSHRTSAAVQQNDHHHENQHDTDRLVVDPDLLENDDNEMTDDDDDDDEGDEGSLDDDDDDDENDYDSKEEEENGSDLQYPQQSPTQAVDSASPATWSNSTTPKRRGGGGHNNPNLFNTPSGASTTDGFTSLTPTRSNGDGSLNVKAISATVTQSLGEQEEQHKQHKQSPPRPAMDPPAFSPAASTTKSKSTPDNRKVTTPKTAAAKQLASMIPSHVEMDQTMMEHLAKAAAQLHAARSGKARRQQQQQQQIQQQYVLEVSGAGSSNSTPSTTTAAERHADPVGQLTQDSTVTTITTTSLPSSTTAPTTKNPTTGNPSGTTTQASTSVVQQTNRAVSFTEQEAQLLQAAAKAGNPNALALAKQTGRSEVQIKAFLRNVDTKNRLLQNLELGFMDHSNTSHGSSQGGATDGTATMRRAGDDEANNHVNSNNEAGGGDYAGDNPTDTVTTPTRPGVGGEGDGGTAATTCGKKLQQPQSGGARGGRGRKPTTTAMNTVPNALCDARILLQGNLLQYNQDEEEHRRHEQEAEEREDAGYQNTNVNENENNDDNMGKLATEVAPSDRGVALLVEDTTTSTTVASDKKDIRNHSDVVHDGSNNHKSRSSENDVATGVDVDVDHSNSLDETSRVPTD